MGRPSGAVVEICPPPTHLSHREPVTPTVMMDAVLGPDTARLQHRIRRGQGATGILNANEDIHSGRRSCPTMAGVSECTAARRVADVFVADGGCDNGGRAEDHRTTEYDRGTDTTRSGRESYPKKGEAIPPDRGKARRDGDEIGPSAASADHRTGRQMLVFA